MATDTDSVRDGQFEQVDFAVANSLIARLREQVIEAAEDDSFPLTENQRQESMDLFDEVAGRLEESLPIMLSEIAMRYFGCERIAAILIIRPTIRVDYGILLFGDLPKVDRERVLDAGLFPSIPARDLTEDLADIDGDLCRFGQAFWRVCSRTVYGRVR